MSSGAGIGSARHAGLRIHIREHKHDGKWRLSQKQRDIVVRAIMFLKSDLEYVWPIVPQWFISLRPIIWLISLGQATKSFDRKYQFEDALDVWPFIDQEQVEATKNEPRYLASAT